MTLSWHPPHTHAISDSLWTVYSFREWGNWSNGQSTWIFYTSTFSYAGWRGNLQVAGVLERPAFLFYQLLFVRNRVALRPQRVRELWKVYFPLGLESSFHSSVTQSEGVFYWEGCRRPGNWPRRDSLDLIWTPSSPTFFIRRGLLIYCSRV